MFWDDLISHAGRLSGRRARESQERTNVYGGLHLEQGALCSFGEDILKKIFIERSSLTHFLCLDKYNPCFFLFFFVFLSGTISMFSIPSVTAKENKVHMNAMD